MGDVALCGMVPRSRSVALVSGHARIRSTVGGAVMLRGNALEYANITASYVVILNNEEQWLRVQAVSMQRPLAC